MPPTLRPLVSQGRNQAAASMRQRMEFGCFASGVILIVM